MFIYSSISFALIVKENRSHKYSLKIFPSRPGELSVFSPQFSSQIQHFCYLSGSVWILPKLKTFPKRAKDKQIVRRLSFKWATPDSTENYIGFCRIHMIWKKGHREIFAIDKISFCSSNFILSFQKRGGIVGTKEKAENWRLKEKRLPREEVTATMSDPPKRLCWPKSAK